MLIKLNFVGNEELLTTGEVNRFEKLVEGYFEELCVRDNDNVFSVENECLSNGIDIRIDIVIEEIKGYRVIFWIPGIIAYLGGEHVCYPIKGDSFGTVVGIVQHLLDPNSTTMIKKLPEKMLSYKEPEVKETSNDKAEKSRLRMLLEKLIKH